MCGRYACYLCCSDLQKALMYKSLGSNKLEEPKWIKTAYEYKPMYNAPPSSIAATMANGKHFEYLSENVLVPMLWTLNPELPGINNTYHNLRAETLQTWNIARPEAQQRCIVLANGMYEWKNEKPVGKQPVFLYHEIKQEGKEDVIVEEFGLHENKPLLKMAGVFSQSKSRTGHYTCAVITKPATGVMASIHSRMPVFLESYKDVKNWLSGFTAAGDLVTYGDDESRSHYQLAYHKVEKQFVNSPAVNDIRCIQKLSPKRKTSTLDNWVTKKQR